jgi:hypothetical protein
MSNRFIVKIFYTINFMILITYTEENHEEYIYIGMYLVQTNLSVQTSNPNHIMLIQGDVRRSGSGDLKRCDQHHVVHIKSLHGCTEGLVCNRYVPYISTTY